MEEKTKLLPITNDYIFKRVFSYEGNEDVLKDLLEAILEIKINKVEVKNQEIIGDTIGSKKRELDIKAELDDGTLIDVEMQAGNEKNIEERSTTYVGELIAGELQAGEKYIELKKVIFIGILNFNYYQRNSYHSIAKMKFEKTKEKERVDMGYKKEEEIASKYMEMHFIEIPKFMKKKTDKEDKLTQWLWLFSGEGEKMKMAEKKNKKVEKAIKTLEKISMDPKEREIQRAIELGEFFQRIRETKAKEEEKVEIAKRMKEKGMEIQLIKEMTGLTEEEIKKL